MIHELVPPRDAELPGQMHVKRILPYRGGRMVGPFAFLDHMGPMPISSGTIGDVPPHPHIGLSTVTYLTSGSLVHRDTIGSVQEILPGDVNWMTAGKGVAHSERIAAKQRERGGIFEGLQAWVALPRHAEECEPNFQHVEKNALPHFAHDGCKVTLISGSAFGVTSPVNIYSKFFYFTCHIPAKQNFNFDPEGQEAAFYLINGNVAVGNKTITGPMLIVFKSGNKIKIHALSDCHGVFLGGEPLDGKRHIWWNFVSSSRERIEAAKKRWQEQKFPPIAGETEFIPLPSS